MKKNARKQLVVALTFLSGLYFFLEFLTPQFILDDLFEGKFETYHEKISDGFILVGAMAVFLGVFNLVRFHGLNILKTRKGWVNSFALILAIFVSLGIRASEVVIQEQRAATLTEVANWGKFTDVVKSDFLEKRNINAGPRLTALAEDIKAFQNETTVVEDSVFSVNGLPSEDSQTLVSSLEKSKNWAQILAASYDRMDISSIENHSSKLKAEPVSYTHLTLPTICSV